VTAAEVPAPRGVVGPALVAGARRAGAGVVAGLAFVGLFLRGRRAVTLPGLASAVHFAAAGYTLSLTVGLAVSAVMLLVIDWRMTGGRDGG
jgi:hypothetical protein